MEIMKELPEVWQQEWQKQGYQAPTTIQKLLYQPAKQAKNILAISPTGTGKTVAYLLPMLQNIQPKAGIQGLIILPSQELAMQVFQVAKSWANSLDIQVQAIIGGVSSKRQIEKLKQKPEIIVGTPGRLVELSRTKKLKLHTVTTVILDEVDHLLADAELQGAKQLLKMTPKFKQVICVSATGEQVIDAVKQLGINDLQVLATEQTNATKSTSVTHGYLVVEARQKIQLVRSIARQPSASALVFFNQLSQLGTVADKLQYEKVKLACLASDESKEQRKKAIADFETGQVPLLLTTEVGARGLDFSALPMVIQYECPYTADSYIHRAGRTGRMGKSGIVLTLLAPNEVRDYKRLMKELALEAQQMTFSYGQIKAYQPNDRKLRPSQVKPNKRKYTKKQKKGSKK